MNNFENKTVFITGGASGIGLALARAFGARGANIMIADINADNLETAKTDLRAGGANVESVVCDVADIDSVRAAADATIAAFGKVHVVFNNAGVSLAASAGKTEIKDWRWIVDINLMGVVHGVEVFTPLMLEHGEGGYMINTASMAGHLAAGKMGPYNATKFAVVGYSESLVRELPPLGIDVGVLCPTWIQTNIHNTTKERPSLVGVDADIDADPLFQMAKAVVENGLPPEHFAELVIQSMAKKRFYTFIDASVRPALDDRRNRIAADFDSCLADLETLA